MSNIDIAAFVEPIIDDWSEAEIYSCSSHLRGTSAEKIIDSITSHSLFQCRTRFDFAHY